MNCPICDHSDHRVIRTDAKDGLVRRSRECLKCAHRWFTAEVPETVLERAAEIAEAWRHMRDAIGE